MLIIYYYVFILDVDVMWCFWIKMGLLDLIGGFVLIVIGVDVCSVDLFVKLIVKNILFVEKVRIIYMLLYIDLMIKIYLILRVRIFLYLIYELIFIYMFVWKLF